MPLVPDNGPYPREAEPRVGEPKRCPRCGRFFEWKQAYVEHAWTES